MLTLQGGHRIELDLIPDEPTIIDAGSRDGDSIQEFLKLFNSPFIIAIEPSRSNISKILQSYDGFLISKALVGDGSPSQMEFVEFTNKPGWGNVHNLYINNAKIQDRYLVDTISWSELYDLINRDIDYLKMDIEGSEIDVIDSITQEQLSTISQISMEFHGNDQQLNRIINKFYNNDFSVEYFHHDKELYARRR